MMKAEILKELRSHHKQNCVTTHEEVDGLICDVHHPPMTDAKLYAERDTEQLNDVNDNIIEEINCVMADCHMSTGNPAVSIYLGRLQMSELAKWANKSRSIVEADKEIRQGKSRPKIMGIPVYEVNDEDHCAVA